MMLSIPHAIEHARSAWAEYIRAQVDSKHSVRVVDTNDVVIEQWPKASMGSP
jgi:hypothetical protein